MSIWKQILVQCLATWYGFGAITLDGVTPPANDSTSADWVSGSRRGMFLMHHDLFTTYWVTDGTICLQEGGWGTSCVLDGFSFAFQVDYFRDSSRESWRKRAGIFQTSGDVDLGKLKGALQMYRRSRTPLSLDDLSRFAAGVSY